MPIPSLQKEFRGVSSYLGRYEGGNLQLNLGGTVQPTFDLDKWASMQEVPDKVDDLQVSLTPVFQVPDQNTIWRISRIGYVLNVPAGHQVYELKPVIYTTAGGFRGLIEYRSLNFTAQGNYYGGIQLDDLWVGESVGIRAIGFIAGALVGANPINIGQYMVRRTFKI